MKNDSNESFHDPLTNDVSAVCHETIFFLLIVRDHLLLGFVNHGILIYQKTSCDESLRFIPVLSLYLSIIGL